MVALWLQITKLTITCEIALSFLSLHRTHVLDVITVILAAFVKTTILIALWLHGGYDSLNQ